jgi:methylmalonyl-CoA mutase N-terminal domain/subunit
MGGSFAIESLTDEVEEKAMAYINHIRDELGDGSVRDGVVQGIQDGYFQREIQDAAYEYQQRVESEEEVMVGVNKYTVEEDTEPEILTVDEDVQERQRDKLATVKAERDDAAVEAALDDLRQVVTDGGNVMPVIIDAVKAYATMGEIMAVFEAEYGSYQETASIA